LKYGGGGLKPPFIRKKLPVSDRLSPKTMILLNDVGNSPAVMATGLVAA
jgi:hypothetical protein